MPSKWEPLHVVRGYKLAKAGLSRAKIAEALGVDYRALQRWCQESHPEMEEAIQMGRDESGGDAPTFKEYVYKNLSPELRPLWEELEKIETEGNPLEKLDRLFENSGKVARQHLFVHALVCSNFNPSEACRRVGIAKQVVDEWIKDPHFAALINEVHYHKKNFCEAALFDLMRGGDSAATIFANKTLNRDRGYADRTTIDVNVSGQIAVNVIDVAQLGLPVEVMRVVLDAIRAGQAAGRIAAPISGQAQAIPASAIDVVAKPKEAA